MRVVHLATGSIGGAKLAAVNLVEAQQSYGYQSILVTNDSRNFFTRARSKITTASQSFWQKENYLLSAVSASQLSHTYLNSLKPDLIHIHNWYNLLSKFDLVELGKNYPVIFTLHDERIYTGGCHLTYSCINFKNNCIKCPAVNVGKKIIENGNINSAQIFRNMDHLGFVSPSNWIAEKFSQSSIGIGLRNPVVIPNIVREPSLSFKPHRLAETNSIKIGFISAHLNEQLKNLSGLTSSLEEVSRKFSKIEFEFHVVGKGQAPKSDSFTVKDYGLLSPARMDFFWSHIDLLVVPSITENFPTIIAEAAARRIPIIGSNVGGIPEMIKHGWNGLLTNLDTHDMANTLITFLQMTAKERIQMGYHNREYFEETFGRESIVEKHKKLYSAIQNKENS